VLQGFGRGSKDLGIPTANLDRAGLQTCTPFDDLPTGIYWGYGRIEPSVVLASNTTNGGGADHGVVPPPVVYKAAISIGYNPTYKNDKKSVEPHLIATESDPRRHASCTGETLLEDFYDLTCRLSVVGYLRPELPFEGLEKLVEAIKQDIVNTEKLGESHDPVAIQEKEWVRSKDTL